MVAATAGQDTDLVCVENAGGRGRFVILCDHASNRLPGWATPPGLEPGQLSRHIAWDPGALGVARRVAQALDAPLLFPDVSRLVIDCNRATDAADSITPRSEDVDIPGNLSLSDDERALRRSRVYEPYHAAIERLLDGRTDGPTLVAVHSFTPTYLGTARPWQVGVLFDDGPSPARRLMEILRRDPELVVGENEPYAPADGVYHTLRLHARPRGLPAVMIEIRNDEIETEAAQEAWAALLSAALVEAAEEAR